MRKNKMLTLFSLLSRTSGRGTLAGVPSLATILRSWVSSTAVLCTEWASAKSGCFVLIYANSIDTKFST